MFQTVDFDWLLGTSLILIYACGRFNRPKTNRVSTTRARFYSAGTAYSAATFLLYILLAGLLSDSPEILKALSAGTLGGPPSDSPEIVKSLSAGTPSGNPVSPGPLTASGPLLAALVLTVLLPNFPVIATVDERLLKFFQTLGNIPLEAILQSEQLYKNGAQVPQPLREDVQTFVRSKLEVSGITVEDLDFTSGRHSPQGYWTLLLALKLQIDGWRSSRGYVGVINDLQEEYSTIQTRFDKLTVAAARYFKMLRETPGSEPGPFLAECKRNFSEQCDDLYRGLCQFVARGVLKSGWTKAERARTLSQMGFKDTQQVGETLNPNQIVALIAMLFAVLLSAVTLVGSQMAVQRAFFIAVMVSCIYGAAIVCAIALKSRWHPTAGNERPVAGYLVSGIIAAGIAALLSVAFKSMLFLDFDRAVADLQLTYPYLALAFMAAAVTSFLCDDFAARPAAAPWFWRWLEGIGAGAVLSGTAYFVWLALSEIHGAATPSRVPELGRFLPMTATIGFIIGATVPTWYRQALRRVAARAGAS